MKELSIGDVARETGLKVSAIRYYEDLGLLRPTRRVHRHRRYNCEVLERLNFIRTLQQVGFDLRQISDLVNAFENSRAPVALCQGMARRKVAELDILLARLKVVRRTLAESLNCDCADLNECAYTLNVTR